MNTYVYVKRGKRSSMCFISSRIKMRVKSGNNKRWIAIKDNKYFFAVYYQFAFG